MNILMLNWRCPSHPQAGGAEYVSFKHAKNWVKKGYEVHWLSGSYLGACRQETIDGVRVFRFSRPTFIPFIAPIIYFLLYRNRISLVIDQFHGVPFFTPLWIPKIKKIAFIHEVAGEIWDSMFFFPISRMGKYIERQVFQLYKKQIFWTDSPSTAKELELLGIVKKQINIIPCSIEKTHTAVSCLKNENLTLVFLGRLVKMKGVEDALDITRQIRTYNPFVKLLIIGTGKKQYIKKLSQTAMRLGLSKSVTFFGKISDKQKYDLLAKAHYLLHTSVKEGFGLTVLEANMQGTPILARNVAGLRDLIVQGYNGYFIESTSMLDIVDVDAKKYKDMCANAADFAKKFDWKTILNQSLTLIDKAINS